VQALTWFYAARFSAIASLLSVLYRHKPAASECGLERSINRKKINPSKSIFQRFSVLHFCGCPQLLSNRSGSDNAAPYPHALVTHLYQPTSCALTGAAQATAFIHMEK